MLWLKLQVFKAGHFQLSEVIRLLIYLPLETKAEAIT